MNDTLESLRRKMTRAGELLSVVRTMKALAAASIGQYERAMRSLGDYSRTVEMGLSIACRDRTIPPPTLNHSTQERIGAIAYGTDQGLTGQFNETLADFAVQFLATIPGSKTVWAMSERVGAHFEDAGLPITGSFPPPHAITSISLHIGQILNRLEPLLRAEQVTTLYLFHNAPQPGAIYKPVLQRLLPFDQAWLNSLWQAPWPTRNQPEALLGSHVTRQALLTEYLFVSLFRACAESLASENAARLAAMQRAEKNIGEMQDNLTHAFHRLRQDSIDAELFDVSAGFEALKE